MLEHGGRLREAAERFGIPLADWLDLSTGINPTGWPVPDLPADCWRRLPEENDGLEAAAAAYYGNHRLMPLPGSQAAIQLLPTLFPAADVALVAPLYNEHPHAWRRAGRRCIEAGSLAEALAGKTRCVLLCNPNNPTGRSIGRAELLTAARELSNDGRWLIVDEAYADGAPELTVAAVAGSEAAANLVVLRSLGKFFGLAGARVGFAIGATDILARLADAIGPWAVAGPARQVARLALSDFAWQAQMRGRLGRAAGRLESLLSPQGEVAATSLFVTLHNERAAELAEFLARRAILVRLWETPPLLRFGLPGGEGDWQRLAAALDQWT